MFCRTQWKFAIKLFLFQKLLFCCWTKLFFFKQFMQIKVTKSTFSNCLLYRVLDFFVMGWCHEWRIYKNCYPVWLQDCRWLKKLRWGRQASVVQRKFCPRFSTAVSCFFFNLLLFSCVLKRGDRLVNSVLQGLTIRGYSIPLSMINDTDPKNFWESLCCFIGVPPSQCPLESVALVQVISACLKILVLVTVDIEDDIKSLLEEVK